MNMVSQILPDGNKMPSSDSLPALQTEITAIVESRNAAIATMQDALDNLSAAYAASNSQMGAAQDFANRCLRNQITQPPVAYFYAAVDTFLIRQLMLPQPNPTRCSMNFLKRGVLWKPTFNDAFTSYCLLMKLSPSEWVGEFVKLLEETQVYWRELEGKRRRMFPEEAAFYAFVEFSDKYFNKYGEITGVEYDLERLAQSMASNGSYTDRSGAYLYGNSIFQKRSISPRWFKYYEQSRERLEKSTKVAEEIKAICISETMLSESVEKLQEGDIPDIAISIWQALKSQGFIHDIADRSKSSIADTLLWILAFQKLKLIRVVSNSNINGVVYISVDLTWGNHDIDDEPYNTLDTYY